MGANVNAKNNYGASPLHCASMDGNIKLVKYLVSAGADVNAKDNDGETPVCWSIRSKNSIEVVNFLFSKAKESNNGKTQYGKTPLHVAAHVGNVEYAKSLVSSGAKEL